MTVLVSTHYMDEAERCHRIHYISYGRLLASGTVEEVIQDAGLHTYVLEGAGLGLLVDELRKADGVDQVAAFGAQLHVVGRNKQKLDRALAPHRDRPGIRVEEGRTSLEDVFIQFMSSSADHKK
jgi:ABC-2 type transport system ATP-binding protein